MVVGGAGLIGSEVVKQLSENGAQICILDNFSSGKQTYIPCSPKIEVIKGDICDKPLVKNIMRNSEIVINVAGLTFIPYSYDNPEDFFRVNVMGTLNLLCEAGNARSVERFVQFSSDEVYGVGRVFPMTEEHPLSPHSTYAVSELAASTLALLSYKEHGMPVVILRPFNTYGPNVTQPSVIPEIIVQLLKGNGRVLLGNVEASRDFTYVSDTARATLLASVKDGVVGEVFNIGTGRVITIRDLAFLIASIMGVKAELVMDETRLRPLDVPRQVCDYSKARSFLSWSPTVTLEDGLRRVISWLRTQPDIVKDWVPYTEKTSKIRC